MKIGIDAGVLGGNDKNLQAGVFVSAVHLFQELRNIDTVHEYIFYSFTPIQKKLLSTFPKKSKNIVLPSTGWLQVILPLAFLKEKPDVFLAVSQAMPRYHPFKTIGFIHGLDFFTTFHQERTNKMSRNTTYLIQHATSLVTTSQFLQKEIARLYKRKDVSVIPLGVSDVFFQKPSQKEKRPYFLFVGTLKASKNIPVLLKSFAIFKKNTNSDHELLLIGSDFWLDENIQITIASLGLEKDIRCIPATDPHALASYYASAAALVSPSLYEGFGLPLIEAMATGCPVIASHVGAIPEVVGDAALLSGPMDVKKIAEYMGMVVTDKNLRSHLIQKGYTQAKKYRWETFARQVLAIIESQ